MSELSQAQLESRFRSLAREGRSISQTMEGAQAQTPLTDHFAELEKMPDSAPQTVIAVGLDQEARGALLQWIAGADYHLLSLSVSSIVGMVEIHLQERGFVLEKADGTREEYDRLDPFVQAIKDADVVRQGDAQSWVDPLKLQMAAPAGVQGLTLVMPESLEALARNPAAFTRAMTQSNWLVVAGMDDTKVGENSLVVLNDWVKSVDVVWPVIFERTNGSADANEKPWWKESLLSHSSVNLPATRLPGQSISPHENLLAAELKRAIFLRYLSRRMNSALQMLVGRQERREKELRQKQADANRSQKRLEGERRKGDTSARELMEQMRSRLDDLNSDLSRELKEENKRLFMPNGKFTELARDMVKGLDESCLEQLESKTVHKLAPSAPYVEQMHSRIRECLRNSLKETVQAVRPRIEDLSHEIADKLAEFHGHPVAIDLDNVDERGVWADMREYVEVSPNYEIDLPKRGVFEAVMAGRSAVFPIIMIVGMLGGAISAFADMRKSFYFVAGFMVLWVAGSMVFRKKTRLQDEERKESELKKMSDGLRNEITKILEKAEREKLDAFGTYLADLRKNTLTDLRLRVEEAVKAAQARVERDVQQVNSVTASVQKHSSDVTASRTQIGRLDGEYRKFDSDCLRWLRDKAQEQAVETARSE